MTKPSLFDRVLAGVSPRLGASRLAGKAMFEAAASGYAVNDWGQRFRTYEHFNRTRPGTEEQALHGADRMRLILECIDLYRNNEIVAGAVSRFADYSVWLGITPQAQTSDPDWNSEAEDWWNQIYSRAVDFRQRQGVDLVSLQRQVVISRAIMGDAFFVLLDNGQLQPVEADRIGTPDKLDNDDRVSDGVRRNQSGIVTGYYVLPRQPGGMPDRSKSEFVKSRDMIHCYWPWRFDQFRGVPDLAPAVAKIRDYDETDMYTLNKVKLDGMQHLKVIKDRVGVANDLPRNSYLKEDASGNKQRVERHNWGQVWNLGLGENVESFEGRTPNSQYVGYMEHELRSIAAALNLPYEYLMLIFTAGSFSAQRAAMLHAQHTFRGIHKFVTDSFLRRLWNWRIAKAIKDGALPPAPVDKRGTSEWWKVDWSLPWFGWVDPVKEVQANKERYNLGSTSLREIARTEGRDRDQILREKASDISEAIRIADELNTAHPGADVTWQHIISSTSPGQVQMANGTESQQNEDENEELV